MTRQTVVIVFCDGDIFSHGFKRMKLGPLIGKRTWGGVIGIWPRHLPADGGLTTHPEFAWWFDHAGWNIENRGAEPDIEVEYAPHDYTAGRDSQLERGVAELMKLIGDHRIGRERPGGGSGVADDAPTLMV